MEAKHDRLPKQSLQTAESLMFPPGDWAVQIFPGLSLIRRGYKLKMIIGSDNFILLWMGGKEGTKEVLASARIPHISTKANEQIKHRLEFPYEKTEGIHGRSISALHAGSRCGH